MRTRDKIKIRTIDIETGEIKEYSSLTDCGKEFGGGSAVVSYLAKRGIVRHGKRFEFVEIPRLNYSIVDVNTHKRPCIVEDINGNVVGEYDSIANMAESYGVTHTTIRYRIRMERPFDGLYFKLADNSKIQVPESILKKDVYEDDDVVLDREKYKILSYQTKNHVCITPCPFLQSPKPMIGSGRCMYCTSFRGRNIKTNEIACNRKYI